MARISQKLALQCEPVPIPVLHEMGFHGDLAICSWPSFTGLRWLPILSYRGRCSATLEACGGRGMRTSARHVRAFLHSKNNVR